MYAIARWLCMQHYRMQLKRRPATVILSWVAPLCTMWLEAIFAAF